MWSGVRHVTSGAYRISDLKIGQVSEMEIYARSVKSIGEAFRAYPVNGPSLKSSVVRECAFDVLFINGVHSRDSSISYLSTRGNGRSLLSFIRDGIYSFNARRDSASDIRARC